VPQGKGGKDRYGSLPDPTLQHLRGFWKTHRHPRLLFANASGNVASPRTASSPRDRGGVQAAVQAARKERYALIQQARLGMESTELPAKVISMERSLGSNTLKSLAKSVINTWKKLHAYSGHSPKVLAKRIYSIARREGLRGVLSRGLLWLYLSGIKPRKLTKWTKLYPYPELEQDDTPQLKVSVIVPNYNHAPYLRKRLESIYNQTYSNIEVILLDDCSSDDSRSILNEFHDRYPSRTRCHFNDINSGGVFHQWTKGFDIARGDLIWIAESDDYCSDNLLEELVAPFSNPAVRIAFCRTVFVDSATNQEVWSSESYLHDLGLKIWTKPFLASAHALTKNGWVVKNIIPNVSAAVFRNPQQLELLKDEKWKSLRLCGDWVFYLAIARGGLVGYSPKATNFYRQHARNTSVVAQREAIYYREHAVVRGYLERYYHLDQLDFERLRNHLYRHWCVHNGINNKYEFERYYDTSSNNQPQSRQGLNIAIVTYALVGGGGETLPLMLANLLHQRGHSVIVINFKQLPSEPAVRKMLLPDIPLLDLNSLRLLDAVAQDMSLDIIHSHHAWVDMTIAALLALNKATKHVVTMHGMYEMMTPELYASLHESLGNVDQYVYTAEKNLSPFSEEFMLKKHFIRISNAVTAGPYLPIEREDLAVGDNDFVLCMVARGIADKGWQEAIEAVLLANTESQRKIHLLLIGDGEEPERLAPQYNGNEFIHFLGFQPQVRAYFACSDMGFIPSRFMGESFPLVLIDCLMTGKPVLASNIGEINQMLTTPKGLAGLVFDLYNWQIPVESLAALIHKIANDSVLYEALSDRVKEAAQRFDPNHMVEEYERVYISLKQQEVRALP
jgi:glycosyltransferase involved in cell wall biosynthesis